MFVSRSEVSCLLSIQRESCETGAKAMSSSFFEREAAADLLRTKRSCVVTVGMLGSIGFQRLAPCCSGRRALVIAQWKLHQLLSFGECVYCNFGPERGSGPECCGRSR